MSASPPLDQVAEQIAMLSTELTMTGRLLYESLEKPMQSLKAGRSPRALGLGNFNAENEVLRQTLLEILGELQPLAAAFQNYSGTLQDATLTQQSQALEQELRFWKSFVERCQILQKKLALIADLEKLSALGRAPIQDAWEEVSALALKSNTKPS